MLCRERKRALRAAACAVYFVAAAAGADVVVYDDAMGPGWENWSWATVNVAATSPVQQGTRSVAVTLDAGWSGLFFHHNGTTGSDRLRFYVHGGSAGGQGFWVRAITQGNVWEAPVDITTYAAPVANAWRLAEIPLADLQANGKVLEGVSFQKQSGDDVPLPTFYVDTMSLAGSAPPTSTPGTGNVSLTIDAAAEVRPISPFIYGMSFPSDAQLAALKLGAQRWGGNATTRYNWELNTTNRANDWFFLNTLESSGPPGAAADDFIARGNAAGVPAVMTIPALGWVAKDGSSSSSTVASQCGPTAPSNPGQTSLPAYPAKGAPFVDPPGTGDGAVYMDEWVAHMQGRFGAGAPRFYSIDNEADIWSSTHIDVHPRCVGYDELADVFVRYGRAVKAVAPGSEVTGPVSTGWWFYWNSMAGAADKTAHGGVDFLPWWLDRIRAADEQHGARTLDVLDVHYYQEPGLLTNNATDAATAAMRLRSTRSLWDPTYTDESWIGQNPPEWTSSQPNGNQVQLLPRLRSLIAAHYPGTKLAITEYSWGALGHITGAIAQAEVLGLFGREGVHLATLWGAPPAGSPGEAAFAVYRNYDGQGGRFGDRSVRAISTNSGALAAYAATDAASGRLTVLVLNKEPATAITAQVSLSNFAPAPVARAYGFDAAQPAAVRRLPDVSAAPVFSASFPPYSATLLVFDPAGAPVATFTPTPTPSLPPSATALPPTATRTTTVTPTRTGTRTPTATRRPTRTKRR